MPWPAHSGFGAFMRIHHAIAAFVAGYACIDRCCSPTARAVSSSPSRHASAISTGQFGWQLTEFDDTQTTAARPAAARAGCSSSTSPMLPK
jgi:hypothetical protein